MLRENRDGILSCILDLMIVMFDVVMRRVIRAWVVRAGEQLENRLILTV